MQTLASFADVQNALRAMPGPDAAAIAAARTRDGMLTKPPGSLGQLESLAEWLAGWRGRVAADRLQVAVFAGNHGIAARGVSAFPAEVTVQMVANFQSGGAAINQLSRLNGAAMTVHPIALDRPTADFTTSPAMSEAEVLEALRIGWDAVGSAGRCLCGGRDGDRQHHQRRRHRRRLVRRQRLGRARDRRR